MTQMSKLVRLSSEPSDATVEAGEAVVDASEDKVEAREAVVEVSDANVEAREGDRRSW